MTVIRSDIGIPLKEAFWTWARIAGLSFGGPAGQIAVMHRILVEEKRLDRRDAGSCTRSITACCCRGRRRTSSRSISAGSCIASAAASWRACCSSCRGLFALAALSWAYAEFGDIGIVKALFFGLKSAVLAIVLEAVLRVGRRALKSRALIVIAALAFIGIFLFALPFPLIVLAAALGGFAGNALKPEWFKAGSGHGASRSESGEPAIIDAVVCAWRAGTCTSVAPSPSYGCGGRRRGLARPAAAVVRDTGPRQRLHLDRGVQQARWRSSPSAAPMRCWPTWRSRRSRIITGSGPARCWWDWASPRRRRDR